MLKWRNFSTPIEQGKYILTKNTNILKNVILINSKKKLAVGFVKRMCVCVCMPTVCFFLSYFSFRSVFFHSFICFVIVSLGFFAKIEILWNDIFKDKLNTPFHKNDALIHTRTHIDFMYLRIFVQKLSTVFFILFWFSTHNLITRFWWPMFIYWNKSTYRMNIRSNENNLNR